MPFLLDVNVLIALIDPAHVLHDRAHGWFAVIAKDGWATCPITENGVLRIVGNARYPNSPGTPAYVLEVLVELTSLAGHIFWPDDLSLLHHRSIRAASMLNSAQISDTYLLALAQAHKGRLATFDRRLVASAVHQGAQALHLIDA